MKEFYLKLLILIGICFFLLFWKIHNITSIHPSQRDRIFSKALILGCIVISCFLFITYFLTSAFITKDSNSIFRHILPFDDEGEIERKYTKFNDDNDNKGKCL